MYPNGQGQNGYDGSQPTTFAFGWRWWSESRKHTKNFLASNSRIKIDVKLAAFWRPPSVLSCWGTMQKLSIPEGVSSQSCATDLGSSKFLKPSPGSKYAFNLSMQKAPIFTTTESRNQVTCRIQQPPLSALYCMPHAAAAIFASRHMHDIREKIWQHTCQLRWAASG